MTAATAAVAELFLVLPAELSAPTAAECLPVLAENAPVASLLLPSAVAATTDGGELAALARELGLAALVADDARAARSLGADGVHLRQATPADVRRLRKAVPAEFVIGACCPTRRHAAMELGEAGADYLMIDQRLEAGGENLLAWWAEMFTVPVVAAQPVGPEEAPGALALGADFLVPTADIWHDAETARAFAVRYAKTLRNPPGKKSLERNGG